MDFCGIFGFVSLLEGFYMILITKKSPVALIGGHYIYHIDNTVMLPISNLERKTNSAEARFQSLIPRYLQMFSQVDLTKNFYFSYTYDITRSLQSNLTSGDQPIPPNEMFVWNDYLTRNIFEKNSAWNIPIIHGFVDQSSTLTIIRNICLRS